MFRQADYIIAQKPTKPGSIEPGSIRRRGTSLNPQQNVCAQHTKKEHTPYSDIKVMILRSELGGATGPQGL